MDASPSFTANPHAEPGCPLCAEPGGQLLWQDTCWRVVRVNDADFPAYYRIIARDHVREFSDLPEPDRVRCMALVCAVEQVLIAQLHPDKVNLAAFGNMVPHLHWHVTARFAWDSHFPQPVWGARQRELMPVAADRLALTLPALDAAVVHALQGL